MIFCGDYDRVGMTSVGMPCLLTCRKDRNCHCCNSPIKNKEKFYRWSMYDWDKLQLMAPIFICEECGDMAINLLDKGYSFSLHGSILEQWKEYLKEEGEIK